MKADRKESRYTVELKPKDDSWKRDLWLGAVILIAVLFVASLIIESSRKPYRAGRNFLKELAMAGMLVLYISTDIALFHGGV